MSSLYKRPDSKYYWWTTRYKGRKVYKSTKQTQKHLAKKVQTEWDLRLVLDNFGFLGCSTHSPIDVTQYCTQYLGFVESRKTVDTWETTRGVLRKFQKYLDYQNVKRLDEITVKVIDGYIDWLELAPKTKKNHLGIISLMIDQAIKEDVLQTNPAKNATLPKIVHKVRHRPLNPIDLKIIFEGAGSWYYYYSFLYHTGLRAGDVALLTHANIDLNKRAIVSFVRKSRRIHEFPLAESLICQLPTGKCNDDPLFPNLYAESSRKLKDNLTKPRKFMQTLLAEANPPRPKATLHSFRATFNNTLRDLGLQIEDRQVLLAHSSSETTKIYTHPNFDLATKYVNLVPDFGKRNQNVTKT